MPEKILLVDDDIDTLRLVGLMLQRQGFQIMAANSGHQALLIAQNENPDLILLDVMMPDMDGYEVTLRLRQNPSTSAIPIIMFTAKNHVDDKVTGFEVGVDDYLIKPTQPRELFSHIRMVLSRGKKTSIPSPIPIGPRERGYVIGIMAAKGGLGVSTLTLNLGISLQKLTEKEIIIAEFRPGEGDIALILGIDQTLGLNNLLNYSPADISTAHVNSELITYELNVRLLLASYMPDDSRFLSSSDHFDSISRRLAYLSDFIVIDLGPSLPPITHKVIQNCDEIIVLIDTNPTTVIRTQELIFELKNRGFGEGRLHAMLYNRQRAENQYSLSQLQQDLRYNLDCFYCCTRIDQQAAKNKIPLVIINPDNITSQQFFRLAENITKRVNVRE
jgi:DNA-binding response OmpR family regulator